MVRRLTVVALAVAVLLGIPAAATADVGWGPAVELSPRTSAIPDTGVGVDGAGNAVVAWVTIVRAKFVVQVAEKPAGGVWSAPIPVSDPSDDSTDPWLSVNARGDAVVVWTTGPSVRSATRPAGGTWGAPTDVVTGGPGDRIWVPKVGLDGEGNAVAIWWSVDPDGLIRSSARPVGGAWTAPVVAVPADGGYAWPALGVDAQGTATLAFTRVTDAGDRIQATTLAPGGTWPEPTDLSEVRPAHGNASVAVSDSQAAAVLWSSVGDTGRSAQAAVRFPGGSWTDAATLSGASERVSTVVGAFTASGALSAIWARGTTGAGIIETAQWSPTSFTWGDAVPLTGSGNIGAPWIDVDERGGAVALWGEYTPTTMVMRAATRAPTGVWGASVPISAAFPGGGDPRVALTPQGTGVAAWERGEGLLSSVFAASLDTVVPGPGGAGAAPVAGVGGAAPAGGGGSPLPVSSQAPAISGLKMTNKRFRVASGRTALSAARAPRGSSFVFTLSAPSRVQIVITRTVTGARSGGRCVALTPKLRRARARRCERVLVVGTLTRAAVPAGRAVVAFTGRLGSRVLGARTYRAIVRAENSAGTSRTAAVSFTIVH